MLPRRAKKSADRGGHLLLRFEGRLLFSVLLAGAPGVILGLLLLWPSRYSLDHKIEVSVLLIFLWLVLSLSTRDNVVNSLRILSNVVSAVNDEDFSFRSTQAISGDALGDLALEINSLSRALAEERLGSLETASLLRKVMAEAGAIIFAFSPDSRVRIINRAGMQFLGKQEEEVLNFTAHELGIADLVEGPPWEVISRMDSGVEKRWIIRRAAFRQSGQPHRLVLLAEASEALRAEERLAWQRLIRVLSHEINNSLAPIRSIARTLGRITSNTKLPMPIAADVSHGLEVIHDRADSLARFLHSYTRLARLPEPSRRTVPLGNLLTRVAALEARLPVKIIAGPQVCVHVDPDQLEQALINLVKNAADSVLLVSQSNIAPDAVTLSWTVRSKDLEIFIRDEGTGLSETENLFVPFYTTKQSGSGIGLLLSRQIIEAHQGTLVLKNRVDRSGCEVQVKLPMSIVEQPEPD
ncbi:MAG: PAS domain-containing sensor histidine kinase [Acidobacteriia bacterium]|nr:PAS domain-containing sensor histidine kinase [Terriglobia bacterium]